MIRRTDRVWIIEIYEKGMWRACADAKLLRRDAQREKRDYWQANYKGVKFRIARYARVSA